MTRSKLEWINLDSPNVTDHAGILKRSTQLSNYPPNFKNKKWKYFNKHFYGKCANKKKARPACLVFSSSGCHNYYCLSLTQKKVLRYQHNFLWEWRCILVLNISKYINDCSYLLITQLELEAARAVGSSGQLDEPGIKKARKTLVDY